MQIRIEALIETKRILGITVNLGTILSSLNFSLV